MNLFTEYHTLDFNDEVQLLYIANFINDVVKPIQENGYVFLSVVDFARICGHGKTCKALRSCLIKVKGSVSTPDGEGKTRPAKWELNEHNWNIFRGTYAAFKSMRETTKHVLDPIAEELIKERVAAAHSER